MVVEAVQHPETPETQAPPSVPADSGEVRAAIVALLPNLRAFARSLCPNPARADDLVQDALVKALANIHRFERGSNLRAWLFTILRNTYYSDLRKKRREVEDAEGEHAARLADRPSQNGALDLDDFKRVFAELSEDHREVLTLVGAMGLAYEEAAEICGCAVGTIKSRANRARRRLAELLGIDTQDDDAAAGQVDPLPLGVIAGSW
jgi:RNA polymerase sigma-70 factor (ECF subfamily)